MFLTKPDFMTLFNAHSSPLQADGSLSAGQKQQLDQLEDFLADLSNQDVSFGVDMLNLDMVITMQTATQMAYVPVTVTNDAIRVLGNRPEEFSLQHDFRRDRLVELLAKELGDRAVLMGTAAAAADYLASKEDQTATVAQVVATAPAIPNGP
jgi:arginine deiminase